MRLPDLGVGEQDVQQRLAALRSKPLNFDPVDAANERWQRDDYRAALPPEQPGEPEPGGSWQTARRLSLAYAFADPAVVEAYFDQSRPLEGRDMLLALHVFGARIYVGTRVAEVVEEERNVDGLRAFVHAWSYRTLEGHVEQGQRDFEVWKWLETGVVEFRTHAYSRPASRNPAFLLGFRVIGRHKQVEFGRQAVARMAVLTSGELARGREPSRAGRFVALYLRHHHQLLVVLHQLGGRMRTGNPRSAERDLGARLEEAAASDLSTLEALLGELERRPSVLAVRSTQLLEKLGRLKPNGTILRRSPVSSVVELEGCSYLLESCRELWVAVERLGLGVWDAHDRAERSRRALETVESLRLRALADLPASDVAGD